MSKELIERLRKAYGPASDEAYIEDADVLKEAAAEIERLDIERATMAHGYRLASQRCADLEAENTELKATVKSLLDVIC